MLAGSRRVVGLSCILSVTISFAHPESAGEQYEHCISGRVVDPHGVGTEDLALNVENSDGFSASGVPVGADGSFITRPLISGTYILQLTRMPRSASLSSTVVGLGIVRVGRTDVTGVTLAVRRESVITGKFRMESTDPKPRWPQYIAASAWIALDGSELKAGTQAETRSGGTFELRNAFGPRVLRCGWTTTPGHEWWFSRVLLDGKDITNVPTDFTEQANRQLEIVFTQEPPTRIAGTVSDAQGRPVWAPWIVMVAADRSLWQQWATTTDVAQGNTDGQFMLAARPGRYFLHAVPQSTFNSLHDARRRAPRFTPEGIPVEVTQRGTATVNLVVRER